MAASDRRQTESQTRCLRRVTLTLASGQSQVSPGSLLTTRMGWGEVSRGLLMTVVMTSLIMLCPHLSWPHLSALMISIVMTDARGHETHRAMSQLGSHAQLCMGQGLFVLMDSLWAPSHSKHRRVVSCHGYLMSSQTEKPITTLYPLQHLTLACQTHHSGTFLWLLK